MSLVISSEEQTNKKRCENSELLSKQGKVSSVDLIFFIEPTDKNDSTMKLDNLKKKRKCIVIFLVIIILSIIGTVFIGFFACNDEMICAFSSTKKLLLDHHHAHLYQHSQSPASLSQQPNHNYNNHHNQNVISNFYNISEVSNSHKHNKLDSHLLGLSYDEVLNDDFQSKFDINKFDVMVSEV